MKMKYEFTGERLYYDGHTLHGIRAISNFGDIKAGDLGGWIERRENLPDDNNAWVDGNAKVFGNARILENAMILDAAEIHSNITIGGNVRVSGNVWVCGEGEIRGNLVIK